MLNEHVTDIVLYSKLQTRYPVQYSGACSPRFYLLVKEPFFFPLSEAGLHSSVTIPVLHVRHRLHMKEGP